LSLKIIRTILDIAPAVLRGTNPLFLLAVHNSRRKTQLQGLAGEKGNNPTVW
jgi:hypothetical protein